MTSELYGLAAMAVLARNGIHPEDDLGPICVLHESDYLEDERYRAEHHYHLDPKCFQISRSRRAVLEVLDPSLLPTFNADNYDPFYACSCGVGSESNLREWIWERAKLAGALRLEEAVNQAHKIAPALDWDLRQRSKGKALVSLSEALMRNPKKGPQQKLLDESLMRLQVLVDGLPSDVLSGTGPEQVLVARVIPLDVPSWGSLNGDIGRMFGHHVWEDIGKTKMMGLLEGNFGDPNQLGATLAVIRAPQSVLGSLSQDTLKHNVTSFSQTGWQRVMVWEDGLTLKDVGERVEKILDYAKALSDGSLEEEGPYSQFTIASDLLVEQGR